MANSHIQIRRAGVNIQIQRRVTHSDWGQIFLVVLLRLGDSGAIVSGVSDSLRYYCAKFGERAGVYPREIDASCLRCSCFAVLLEGEAFAARGRGHSGHDGRQA